MKEIISIVEIMKCEVCNNHKRNCTICPISNSCKDGTLSELIEETKLTKKYTMEIED